MLNFSTSPSGFVETGLGCHHDADANEQYPNEQHLARLLNQ